MKRFVKILSFVMICLFGFGIFAISQFSDETNYLIVNDITELNNDPDEGDEVIVEDDFLQIFTDEGAYNNPSAVIRLTHDVNLAGRDLSALYEFYQTKRVFKGTLDGNGYTITNLTLYPCFNAYGLFPYAEGATIKNLKIEGEVNYIIDNTNVNIINAGTLIGYGENINIQNCEINVRMASSTLDVSEQLKYKNKDSEKINAYSGVNFGVLAGKVDQIGELLKANISNITNFSDIALNLHSPASVSVGGLIGQYQQASILNVISYGDIALTSEVDASTKSQYLGGIVGFATGTSSAIKNACYIGDIAFQNTNLDAVKGAVLGGASTSSKPKSDNINFDYWTTNLNAVGAGLSLSGNKIRQVDSIDKTFLQNTANFDSSSLSFDFDEIFMTISSKVHLQHFQTFAYSFGSYSDSINSAKYNYTDETGARSESVIDSIKYGREIEIEIRLKSDYVGYCYLSGVSLSGAYLDMSKLDIEEIFENGKTCGYKIKINVSNKTQGSYSFSMADNEFECIVTVSDEAKANDQGGVKATSGSSTTKSMTLRLSRKSSIQHITAKGNGIFNFSFWKLYYKNSEDEWEEKIFTLKDNSTIDIKYGNEPFDQVFKLVAYFDDSDAIFINVGEIDSVKINKITVNNQTWSGEQIAVPRVSIPFEIVTNKDYVINIENFISETTKIYGENSITKTSDPIKDEEKGLTTYKFSINLKNATNIDNNHFNVTVNATRANDKSSSNLTWLWILLIGLVVVGAIVAAVIIIKKRGGGGKGKRPKQTEKKEFYTYDDYYI